MFLIGMGFVEGFLSFVDVVIPPALVEFLGREVIINSFIWFNYWSFVHFFAGVLFYFLLKGNFRIWVVVNVVFEIIEFILGTTRHPLFFEEFKDIVWDVIFSLIGFLITMKIVHLWKGRKRIG
jgi:hypothetical protein